MIKSDVKSVEVCYLKVKDSYYMTNLLSELYYRNSRNISSPDDDLYKLAPESFTYSPSDLKIENTQIKNIHVLNGLREKYGDDWPVGNDTSR